MPTPAAFRPLRHRRFATIWGAGLISNIGTWMQTVAVGALVQGTTGNPVWTAITFFVGFLPSGVLGPVGGALADRFDRRRSIMAFTAVEAALAGVLSLAVARGYTSPALVTSVVFLAGCVNAIRMPFQQAMLPDLVPREDMVGAISLGSAQWNLGRVLGPAAAGFVVVAGSFSLAFAINALSFLAIIVAYAVVRVQSVPAGEPYAGLRSHIAAGVRAVRAEPGCRAAIGLIAAAAFFAAPFIALVPVMADTLTEGGAEEIAGATGALTTAQGIGAVIGSVVLPSLVERVGRKRALVFHLTATPVALVPYALAPNLPVATVTLGLVGWLYIGILSGLSATMQLRAPIEFRGRVLSLYFATLSVVFPFGGLLQGAFAGRIGLRPTTIAGAAGLLVVLLVLRALRPAVLDALADPEVEEPVGLVPEAEAGVP